MFVIGREYDEAVSQSSAKDLAQVGSVAFGMNRSVLPVANLRGFKNQFTGSSDSVFLPTVAMRPDVPEQVSGVVTSNANFTNKLYPELVASTGKNANMVASMLSLTMAMAMLYHGAHGNTADQMKDILAFPDNDTLKEGCEALSKLLEAEIGEDCHLKIANRVYIQKGYSILPSYIDLLKEYYLADAEELDFRQVEHSLRVINDWVANKTNGKIEDLLSEGSITQATRMVLVNAIYFYGTWKHKFARTATGPESFTTYDGNDKLVETMHQTAKFKYSDQEDCRILELPYKGDKLSMLLFLPPLSPGATEYDNNASVKVFDALEKKFKAFDFSALVLEEPEDVEVALPKFKIESQHNDLVQNLKDLGLDNMFEQGKADFSQMDGSDELYVSAVVQKAFINVDEEGSEAAAATTVLMCGMCAPPRVPPRKFICNRSFLFAIKHNPTGMPVFTGRVTDPSEPASGVSLGVTRVSQEGHRPGEEYVKKLEKMMHDARHLF